MLVRARNRGRPPGPRPSPPWRDRPDPAVTAPLPGAPYNRAMNNRRLITGATATACMLCLAACGSGTKKPTSHVSAFMAYSVCMRANGVPNFPDPSGGGGIQLPAGIDPTSPSFESAQKRCQHKLPGGGPGNAKPSKQALAAAVRTAECMREHGVSDFPDPYVASGPPRLDPSKYSLVEDRGGIVIAIPKAIDPTSPAFQKASRSCGFS